MCVCSLFILTCLAFSSSAFLVPHFPAVRFQSPHVGVDSSRSLYVQNSIAICTGTFIH